MERLRVLHRCTIAKYYKIKPEEYNLCVLYVILRLWTSASFFKNDQLPKLDRVNKTEVNLYFSVFPDSYAALSLSFSVLAAMLTVFPPSIIF